MKNNLFKGLVVKGIITVRKVSNLPVVKKTLKDAINQTINNIGDLSFSSSAEKSMNQAVDSVLKAKENLSDKDDDVKVRVTRTIRRLKRDFQNIKEDGLVDILLKGKSMITIKNGKIYFRKDKIVNTLFDTLMYFTDSFINNLFVNLEISTSQSDVAVG